MYDKFVDFYTKNLKSHTLHDFWLFDRVNGGLLYVLVLCDWPIDGVCFIGGTTSHSQLHLNGV